MTTQTKVFIWVVLILGGLTFWANIAINGEEAWAKGISYAVTVNAGAYLLFTRFLWKKTIFQNWLVTIPIVEGTYQGTIESNFIDPDTQQPRDAIPALVTIKQGFSKIHVWLRTAENESHSLTASIINTPDEQISRLIYTYNATPKATLQSQSPIHLGTASLEIENDNSFTLRGSYWTSRGTTGDMNFKQVSKLIEKNKFDELAKKPDAPKTS